MKKRIIAVAAMSMLFAGVVHASSLNGDFNGNPIVNVMSNGKALTVEDTPAIVYNDRTMVPIYMLRQLGAIVTWNQETYSVDVAMPKSESQTNIETLRKYAIASDYCVYFEDAVKYIFSFSSAMDLYAKGSITEDQAYKQYSDTIAKVNELYNKAVDANKKVNDPAIWGNINTYISGSYDISKQLEDAYIDVAAYKLAIAQNDPAQVSNESYNSYLEKVKKAGTQTTNLIDNVQAEYNKDINKIVQ